MLSLTAQKAIGSSQEQGAKRVDHKLTGPLDRLPDTFTYPERLYRDHPEDVLSEVKKTILLIFSQFDFHQLERVFGDILRLFDGKYPGYRRCNTLYHDLKHTLDCFHATARLIHGAFVNGLRFEPGDVNLGLISALMHDTGYIQTQEDYTGTGAKYTLGHVQRSIDFMAKYVQDHRFPPEYLPIGSAFLRCTGLDVKITEIKFRSREHEILGKILGTADLVGQMAQENYLEKLAFLYNEFKEGGVPGYIDALDLLKKTPGFWDMVQERMAVELGRVDLYLRDHFRVSRGIDQDLYRKAIERNVEHVIFIKNNLEANGARYRGEEDQGGMMVRSPV